jgi:hypothetical protein
LAAVIAPSAIVEVVTAELAIFVVVTALSAMTPVCTYVVKYASKENKRRGCYTPPANLSLDEVH